jgi:hypothetical protein
MSVEFVIRCIDLRRALAELNANRGEYKESDSVDMLVSECAATFRAIGTETEAPIQGKQPGSVRVPLRIVDAIQRAAPSLKTKNLTFACEPGVIRIGTWSVKHPDIELGVFPDQRLSLPVNISTLEMLALAQILAPEQIVQEGLRERVEDAQNARAKAIAAATENLKCLEITHAQILEYFARNSFLSKDFACVLPLTL